MLRKKLILILAALVLGISGTAKAAIPLRQAVYQYAQRGDVQGLQKLRDAGHDIDVVDGSGKTVLCSAVASKNVKAYNALIKAGANANHSCMDNISPEQKKALCSQSGAVGSSVCPEKSTAANTRRNSRAAGRKKSGESFWTTPAGMATIGGVAVVGGVAAIAAGGGGGGGGSKKEDCSGHGTYDEEREICVCTKGWEGSDCSIKQTCPNDCSGHGTCDEETATCTCDDDYEGEDCSREKTCPNNCSGQGSCDRVTKTCTCYPGFEGDDCSVAQACDKNCNGNGTCEYTGEGSERRMACTCNRGYSGDSCDAFVCDNVDCGSNGQCELSEDDPVKPVCTCNPGYTGDHCDIKDLCYDARCGKHGSCNIATGFCICEDGFSSSNSKKKDCDVASDFVVEDVTQQEADDKRVYGDKVVNGVYTLPFTDGANEIAFVDVDNNLIIGSGDVTWNDKNYTVSQIATEGLETKNGEDGIINVVGNDSRIAVGLWANGVGEGALTESGGTVKLAHASKARNEGSAIESEDEDGNKTITIVGGTINAIESSKTNKGVIGMKASSAAEFTNSGIINVTAKSANVSIAMDASRISPNVPNKGANVINDGEVNIRAFGEALNVWGIYAPDRNVINNATASVNIILGNSDEDVDVSAYPFTLDRNIARGITGKVVSNKGTVSAGVAGSTLFPDEVGGTLGASELRVMEATAGGYVVNDTSGIIKLDLTNLLYNVSVLYTTPDASTENGTTAINNGTIIVSGELMNSIDVAKHVYIIGSGAGKSTLKNEGKIMLGSAADPIDVSNGGILNVIDGAKGSAESNNDVTMYMHSSNALGAMLSSSVIVMSGEGATIENNGAITTVISGFYKKGSSYSALNTKGGADIEQTNNGIIDIRSSSDGLELDGMKSAGKKTNGEDGFIYLTSSGYNSDLKGFTGSGGEGGSAINQGKIILTHNGGSGNMRAAGGTNDGSVYIRALNMTTETSGTKKILNSFKGAYSSLGGGESGATSGTGTIDIELTGSSRGYATGASYIGDENSETLLNSVNILANNLTNTSDATLILTGVSSERLYEKEQQGSLTYTNNLFISVAGQENNATYVNGMTGIDQSISNDGVIKIDVDLGKSKKHQIIGMRTQDNRYGMSIPTSWVEEPDSLISALGHVPLGNYMGVNYDGGYGHNEFKAVNNNTIQISVYGGSRNDLKDDDQITYREGIDDRYPFGIEYPESFLYDEEISPIGYTKNLSADSNVILKPLSIKNYSTGVLETFYPDVIGMATNSVAINNGTIDITISGNSDARAVGMLAYEGGFIQNSASGVIRFSGKTENFIPFYAYGTRVTLLDDKENKPHDFEINYATFSNKGTIEINGIEESHSATLGGSTKTTNPAYNPNNPGSYDPDDPNTWNPSGPGEVQTDDVGFYEADSWAREVYKWEKGSINGEEAWIMKYDEENSTVDSSTVPILDYYNVTNSGSASGGSSGDSSGSDSGDSSGDSSGGDSGDTSGDTGGSDSGDTSGDTGGSDSGDSSGDSGIPSGTSISSLSSVASSSDLSENVASIPSLMISQNIKFISEDGGSFSANGYHLLGEVMAGASIVQKGNEDVYVADGKGSGAFVGDGDYSDMSVISSTPLFDASYALNENNSNGIDIVMTRKPFEEVVDNSNLAQFLESNYVAGNNEEFFNKLKSFETVSSLLQGLDDLTGKQMLTRFNFEDITMMREMNFDMNEKLFHDKKQQFALSGSVSPMAFKGDTGSSSKYGLYNRHIGNFSVGLGVAFTNIYSDNSHDSDNRRDNAYQLIAPIGYKTHGFNLVSSARMGYARGNYTRTGFENKSYKGTLEKRLFGLTNEARYPLSVGEWTVEPAAEFNVLGYTQRGSEDEREFSLNVKSQSTYSVEAGIGLYLTKEEQLSKDSNLKLNVGVAAYHEFADPYKVDVEMNGMRGHFTLRDEDRSDNRGVIRSGFDYKTGPYTFYGSMTSYIDHELRANAKTGFKWNF